ncbi:MAG: Bax inhibitor-1/YccA family protein [Verrucomicrobiae bacterium]
MNNPIFNEKRIESIESTSSDTMTVSGTIHKTTFLAAIAAATATLTWSLAGTNLAVPTLIGGSILALISVFAASWKPAFSPVLAPVYAISEVLISPESDLARL